MTAMRRWTWNVVGWACLSAATGAATPPASAVTTADRYVGLLDAADPLTRHRATDGLAQLGPAVRPAVVRALPSASPEAAGRLLAVLLRTGPWDVGGEGDGALRLTFKDYAALGPDDRCGRVESLQVSEVVTATPADVADMLVRVLTADPSPAVRWAAANGLRLRFDDPTLGSGPAGPGGAGGGTTAGRLLGERVVRLVDAPPDPAAYPVPADNGPLLAAAAWALRGTDPGRADALVARALAVEAAAPSAFRGQADFAYLWAADRAVDRGDFRAAAGLVRQLAERSAYSAVEIPEAVGDLFALHADHGPVGGLADDVRVYRPYVARPELVYCLGRVAGRVGGPVAGPVLEAAANAVAVAAGGPSAGGHCGTALFLFRHGWTDLAERELLACLWLTGGRSADAYFALHAVANSCDDDAAAGRFLEGALRLNRAGLSRYGPREGWTEADAWAEVHWHYLRAAVAAGDQVAALAEAQQVLALDASGHVLQDDPGMAADIVPVLVDAGLTHRADACFDAAYDLLKAQAAAEPAAAMPKNNLAWLCGRSDRHMDEADALSAQAVELAANDAACLDTRADVVCRLGRPAEAVSLEERALSVRPQDVYMQRQLTRFRGAAKR